MLKIVNQDTREIMLSAYRAKTVIPAFNIPYLPMVEPIINALKDTGTFGLIQVARLEWIKFKSESMEAVAREYFIHASDAHARLHLDHVPVIDEDGWSVDYPDILRKALDLGYQSLMIDGSRLALEENIRITSFACTIAHDGGVPIEAELGAVLGHESGPLPPYEKLFKSGKGFTDVDQAKRFADETGVDWLSVAIGNIHGAVSGVLKNEKKVAARLDINRLKAINEAIGIPLVLHGGSGIPQNYIQEAIKNGIAKINIGTNIRQAYEKAFTQTASVMKAQNAVYENVKDIVINELKQKQVIS